MDVSLPAKLNLIAGIFMSLVATTAVAATTESLPCMEEIEKFCKDVQPGAWRIVKCLNGHEKDLTPVCREKVDRSLARFEDTKKTCAEDVRTFCGDVQPGGGRVLNCLKTKKEIISPACRKRVEIRGGEKEPRNVAPVK
jgi:hypothetical protein